MKTFNKENVSTTKQFTSAVKEVFSGIAGRNQQIQELLVLAVEEAAKESGGQVTNNLSWLSNVLTIAEETKGVNATRIGKYVKEVLCCSTVSWNDVKKSLKKSPVVANLEYNITPDCTWMDYGKADRVAKAFDYNKAITNAITKGLDDEKGGLSMADVLKAVLAGGVSATDLGLALEFMADDVEVELAEEVRV